VRIFGISLDDVATQARFAKAQGLPFRLLSDADGSAAARYRVLAPGGRYAQRVTFVVDPKGAIRHVDRSVDVSSHGSDLLGVVRALRESDR
jgi:peroxiredoxin